MAAGFFEDTFDFFMYAFSSDPVNGNFFDFFGEEINLGKINAIEIAQCSNIFLNMNTPWNIQNLNQNSTMVHLSPNCLSNIKPSCQANFNHQCKLSGLFKNMKMLAPSPSGINLPNACNSRYHEKPVKACFNWIAKNLFRNSLFPVFSNIVNIQATIQNTASLNFYEDGEFVDIVDKNITIDDKIVQMNHTSCFLAVDQTLIDVSSSDIHADIANKFNEAILPKYVTYNNSNEQYAIPNKHNESSSMGSSLVTCSLAIILLNLIL